MRGVLGKIAPMHNTAMYSHGCGALSAVLRAPLVDIANNAIAPE